MTFAEKIYHNSPILVQNALLSIYGARLYYERYSGKCARYFRELLQTQWMTEVDIERYQVARIQELLNHVYRNVPYYQDLFKKNGFQPSDFVTLADLKKIPLLEKETLRTSSDFMIARNISKRSLIGLNTSGTTGKTLKIMVDLDSRRKAYAFFRRFHMWCGLKSGKHNVTFGGRVIIPLRQRSKTFWRYNAAMDNYLFSSYHMSDENLPYYVNKIRKINPLWFESYPSAIYTLARFMLENNLGGIHPKVVVTSAESLLDYQRECIEAAFGCPVRDQYGCTEQALFVSQCEQGTYHINPEYGIVEILNDSGDDAQPSEIGKIVCTSFVNRATPLIRYNLGDTAARGHDECRCGRNFPVIEKLYGRKDDFIITPDGRKVGRLDPIFKGLTSIKSAQIIQDELAVIKIMIVPGESYNDLDGEILKKELRNRLGESIQILIEKVDSLTRTESGKIRAVVSNINE